MAQVAMNLLIKGSLGDLEERDKSQRSVSGLTARA
jgi:hypothetical protein